MKTAKNTVCLWFEKDAEAAARFYTATFPGCRTVWFTAFAATPSGYWVSFAVSQP